MHRKGVDSRRSAPRVDKKSLKEQIMFLTVSITGMEKGVEFSANFCEPAKGL